MKYNVGDKVKIREDLKYDTKYYMDDGTHWNTFVPEMKSFLGAVVTIKEISYGNSYRLEETDRWNWTDEMFEGLAKPTLDLNIIKGAKSDIDMKKCKIKDYKIYNDKVVVVWFDDGTEEKATVCEGDKFDLEYGISLCCLKHIYGRDGYKAMVKDFMRQIKSIDKAKEEKQKTEELIAKKKAKAARRKARHQENRRKKRIAEMQEAIIGALKECNGDLSKAMHEVSRCSCEDIAIVTCSCNDESWDDCK